jgi:DNA-binding IclR family transcriptional regulator
MPVAFFRMKGIIVSYKEFNDIINDTKMEVIERTVKVLDLLSANGGKMRFSDLASALTLPSPSTLTRLLKALCDAGALHKDQQGWYCISSKAGTWGSVASSKLTLEQMVHPELEALNNEFKVSVIVFKYQSPDMMLCVDKIADENSPSLQDAGALLPVNLGVIGSYFIYAENPIEEPEYIAHFADVENIEEVLQQFTHGAEKDCCVYDYGRLFPDNHRLAVSIRFNGKTLAVLGAGFTPSRLMNEAFIFDLTTALKKSADNIEQVINEQHGDC